MKLFFLTRNYGRCLSSICGGFLGSFIFYIAIDIFTRTSFIFKTFDVNYRQRPECICSRPKLPHLSSRILLNDKQPSFCSLYSSQRGPHQRIISVTLFAPKDVQIFDLHRTLNYLRLLIKDIHAIYSDGYILRVYHEDKINAADIICPIECEHSNVDFCNMQNKMFIPPEIWRFIPAGDPLVDIMISRNLDSALTKRERAAVNEWLASKKSFHVMRDHPTHKMRMLGGTWGFRPSLNRSLSRLILNKIHNRELIKQYIGRADQLFLSSHVWPFATSSLLIHDSFYCMSTLGHKTEPFPTQRPSANATNCYVGCARTCCGQGKLPFGPCPKQCRPKNHPEWTYC
ncbi:unnamed protein product [Rotaria magnacalcarata]|uniref:Uncharacterized protein n=1 Tax=Rotaria magnacalcarata TaxID=392030 RepID=A0A819KK05_9BILA|nr:unnamed protein product [Rotaria magnacalcarata]CAF2154030.1 unnamed protein product [Rotaria magnacalcarata]CAF3925020.1 unnamed protein product [Rotaria magnacalcarata]CAF3948456.1 unnamed protein product [Rotaria magnacalcarata]